MGRINVASVVQAMPLSEVLDLANRAFIPEDWDSVGLRDMSTLQQLLLAVFEATIAMGASPDELVRWLLAEHRDEPEVPVTEGEPLWSPGVEVDGEKLEFGAFTDFKVARLCLIGQLRLSMTNAFEAGDVKAAAERSILALVTSDSFKENEEFSATVEGNRVRWYIRKL